MSDNPLAVAVLAAAAGALIFWNSAARAGEPSGVTFAGEGCLAISSAEISRILHIELRTIADGKPEVHPVPISVAADCDDDSALLTATVVDTGAQFSQVVPLSTDAEAGESEDARLIAIAAAELVFSAWVAEAPAAGDASNKGEGPSDAVSETHNMQTPPAPAVAVSGEPSQQQPPLRRVSMSIGPSWRMFVSGGAHLFGGELSLAIRPTRFLFFRGGLSVEGGQTSRAVGTVTLFDVNGAAAVGLEKRFSVPILLAGEVGGRFGYGILSGKSEAEGVRPARVDGGFGGPMGAVRVGVVTVPAVLCAAEVGYAVYGDTGRVAEGDDVHIAGVWVSVTLAIGIDF